MPRQSKASPELQRVVKKQAGRMPATYPDHFAKFACHEAGQIPKGRLQVTYYGANAGRYYIGCGPCRTSHFLTAPLDPDRMRIVRAAIAAQEAHEKSLKQATDDLLNEQKAAERELKDLRKAQVKVNQATARADTKKAREFAKHLIDRNPTFRDLMMREDTSFLTPASHIKSGQSGRPPPTSLASAVKTEPSSPSERPSSGSRPSDARSAVAGPSRIIQAIDSMAPWSPEPSHPKGLDNRITFGEANATDDAGLKCKGKGKARVMEWDGDFLDLSVDSDEDI